jgi:hypothetical protein
MSELTSFCARFNNAYARGAPGALKPARGSHGAGQIDLRRLDIVRDAPLDRLAVAR